MHANNGLKWLGHTCVSAGAAKLHRLNILPVDPGNNHVLHQATQI